MIFFKPFNCFLVVKSFNFIVLLLLIAVQLSAEAGNGTISSPFYGTITESRTWDPVNFTDGTVYVGTTDNPDLTISTGGTLNILPGITVIFTQTTSDLIVGGYNGKLIATGTFSQRILFTTSNIYRGHISFVNTSSNQDDMSIMSYCIIEKGRSSSGGGIYTDQIYLSVSNTIIRNNSATSGGGLYLASKETETPLYSFVNCIIIHNTAKIGGGMFLPSNNLNSVLINNSVIALNIGNSDANNIMFNNTTGKPLIYNTIIWPEYDTVTGNISISYQDVDPEESDFRYCALGTGYEYSNCLVINDANNALDGPNFYNPEVDDFRLKLSSPCRDNGNGNLYPNTYDFAGNSRIGQYDIGSFEVQYTIWTGALSSDWYNSGNWNPSVPPSGGNINVIIPFTSSIPEANNLTVASDFILLIEPGGALTLDGTLTNNGTVRLESDATGIASLIMNNYIDNGQEEIELYLIGGYTEDLNHNRFYKWHYISSPVNTLSSNIFSARTLNLAQYVESLVINDPIQGYIAFDGYDYYTGGQRNEYSFSNLTAGKGYNYYFLGDETYNFNGSFNTSDITVSLTRQGTLDGTNGFNLIGNPFSSCLDWDEDTLSLPASVGNAIYFTVNGKNASYINGIGQGGATGIIPPMQGFFVRTTTDNTELTLHKSARIHDQNQARYKGEFKIPNIRLKLENQSDSDDLVIRFDEKATIKYDKSFDAYKFSKNGGMVNIWTKSENVEYSINGMPFPSRSVEIPIGFFVSSEGAFKLSPDKIEGLDNYEVFLIDKISNLRVDLQKNEEILFSAEKGINENRFVLLINNLSVGIEDLKDSPELFDISQSKGAFLITPRNELLENTIGIINVYDITGRKLLQKGDVLWNIDQPEMINVNNPGGILLIEIITGHTRYVRKIYSFTN